MAPPKFGLFSTAQEVVDAFGSSLSGKTALITGGQYAPVAVKPFLVGTAVHIIISQGLLASAMAFVKQILSLCTHTSSSDSDETK